MAVNLNNEFDPARYQPAGYSLLVEIGRESAVTAAGLYKPVSHLENKEMQKMTATFVRAGCCCFASGDKWEDSNIPKQGETIVIAKYSGEDFVDESTGRKFRIIKDKDYIGRFSAEPVDSYMDDTAAVTERIRIEKEREEEKLKTEKARGY